MTAFTPSLTLPARSRSAPFPFLSAAVAAVALPLTSGAARAAGLFERGCLPWPLSLWYWFRVFRQEARPQEIRWLIYFGPPRRCIAATLRYATDGFWQVGGRDYPFLQRTALFWKLHVGRWLFWVRTQMLSPSDVALAELTADDLRPVYLPVLTPRERVWRVVTVLLGCVCAWCLFRLLRWCFHRVADRGTGRPR